MNDFQVTLMFSIYFYSLKIYFSFHAFVCVLMPCVSCGGQKRALNY